MYRILIACLIATTLLIVAPLELDAASSQCRYCKSTTFGRGCPYSPHKTHEHITDAAHCAWCGKSTYGRGCPYSPEKIHKHGIDGKHCTWCGSTNAGRGCPYAPDKVHRR